MKLQNFLNSTLIVALASVTFVACGDDDDDDKATTGNVTFSVEHFVGNVALEFDSQDYPYTNEFGNEYKVTKLLYYLSDFKLHNSTETVGRDNNSSYLYINGKDSTDFTYTLEEVPNGEYTSATFYFGLDEDKVPFGELPATTENINMEWPTQLFAGGGYHYMKFEGKFMAADTTEKGFATHAGPHTAQQHYFQVTLNFTNPIVVNGDDNEVKIKADLNNWYTNPNTWDFNNYTNGIMMNADAQMKLMQNGNDVFSLAN